MRKFFLLCGLGIVLSGLSYSQDARTILARSLQQCKYVGSGNYNMTIKQRSFKDKDFSEVTALCSFTTRNDSLFPWKFFVQMNNGDGAICAEQMFISMKASDSTAAIYLARENPNVIRAADQTEGLFPPFFSPVQVFSPERWKEGTFILRMKPDKTVDGKSCYQVQMIDVSRTVQRKEKTLFIDKESMLPMEYSEYNIIMIEKDSMVKQTTYSLSGFDTAVPDDSLFSYNRVPSMFRMRNVMPVLYHHHLKSGAEAPYFEERGIDGKPIMVPERGKSYLLMFMNLSSFPALKALKEVHELRDRFKHVEIIMIAMDARTKELFQFAERRKLGIKSFADMQQVTSNYYINASPTFVVVNTNGIVQAVEVGYGEGTGERLGKAME